MLLVWFNAIFYQTELVVLYRPSFIHHAREHICSCVCVVKVFVFVDLISNMQCCCRVSIQYIYLRCWLYIVQSSYYRFNKLSQRMTTQKTKTKKKPARCGFASLQSASWIWRHWWATRKCLHAYTPMQLFAAIISCCNRFRVLRCKTYARKYSAMVMGLIKNPYFSSTISFKKQMD